VRLHFNLTLAHLIRFYSAVESNAGRPTDDLPTWLDSPAAVMGNLNNVSDGESEGSRGAAEAVVDEDGFHEKVLVDASPGDDMDKENDINGRSRRRAGRRRGRLSSAPETPTAGILGLHAVALTTP